MDNVLKPATIIPRELYVHRDADRQLKRVIQDMGRPGYILVSRQMGKTNLLLNAKRELESDDCIFVYIDLSTKFDTARETFKNIIDTAISTKHKLFHSVANELAEMRTRNESISPHKEHEHELLFLLRTYAGKIVVVLDEIDALVNTDYSDQFFAQIRSIYFTRVNYEEFGRLTYVLSGVVEPSNIIKDKNRSPFNIGEKIYLDDFTYQEYSSFIDKLHPEIKRVCGEKIFAWTNGHPRMTWDVCATIEDMFLEKKSIEEGDVGLAVRKLYLDNFDKAPVDHIRDLVQKNIEVRRAVRDIWAGRSSLGESVKRKLYLAGIIKSDVVSLSIEIKNNVIKEALSLSWLEGIDKSNIDLLSIGSEQKNVGNFSEAIKYYLDYIKEYGADDIDLSNAVYYDIGYCYAKLFDFENAIIYYSKCLFDKKAKSSQYFNGLLDIGLCHFGNNDFEKAIAMFKEIISDSKPSIIRIKASLNYAASLTRLDFGTNKNEVLLRYNDILDEIGSIDFNDLNEPKEIKAICYSNIGYIAKCDGNIENAILNYRKAIDTDLHKFLPAIYLRLLGIESDKAVKNELLKDAVRTILENKPAIDNHSSQNSIAFSNYVLSDLLLHTYESSERDIFTELAEYSRDNVFTKYQAPYELILGLANFAKTSMRYIVGIRLYEEALNDIVDSPTLKGLPAILIDVYRSLCIMKFHMKLDYVNEYNNYIDLFQLLTPTLINDDFKAFTIHTIKLRNLKKNEEAIKNLDVILSRYESEPCDVQPDYIGLLFLKAQLYDLMKNKKVSFLSAKEVLRLIDLFDPNKSDSISMQEVDLINVEAQKLLSKNSIYEPIVRSKVGRNDICICGSELKYKKCCGK